MRIIITPIEELSHFVDLQGRGIVVMPRRYELTPCFTVSISVNDMVERLFLRVRSDVHIRSIGDEHYLAFTNLIHSGGYYWPETYYEISLSPHSLAEWRNQTQDIPMDIG